MTVLLGGHSGFSILPKDTSANGIEPPTCLEDDRSTSQADVAELS